MVQTEDAAPARRTARRTVVLQSFREPRPSTNPYLVQLGQALAPSVAVVFFSWRRALLGRWDVLHLHWPDVVFRRSGALRTAAGMALFALVLVRARLTRRPVVRTLHNLTPHEPRGGAERRLLELTDRWTTVWIALDDAVRPAATGRDGAPAVCLLVPLGDYTGWYAGHALPDAVPGRLLSFGLVRPYKGVEDLVAAFADVPGDVSLAVVGRPSSAGYAAAVASSAAPDARVRTRLEHVPDADLVREIGEAELVVLPYRKMQSSSAALLALSLGRPVLLPSNPLTEALAAEAGRSWVLTFVGDLTAGHLGDALAAVRRPGRGLPDLSRRSWPSVAAGHVAAYDTALGMVGRERVGLAGAPTATPVAPA